MTPLPVLGQAPPPAPPAGWPLFRMAFRPFYLLAAIGIATLAPLWLAVLTGRVQLAGGLAPNLWHGHEMIFGAVAAVVVGFLFTAGKTWTGLPTPRGLPLGLLAALWLAARVAAVTGPAPLFVALDAAFLPLCTLAFGAVIVRAGNRRNFIVVAALALIAFANVGFHLAYVGIGPAAPSLALKAGVAGLVLMETLIAGRVIPFFTRNVNPGLDNAVPAWRERALGVATLLALALWLAAAPPRVAAPVLALTAALHGWRLCTWRPGGARRRPIVWSLHLAYAWIPVGFALLAQAALVGAPDSSAVHAFAIGATGGLMIAMMTRTARGHTARPLQVALPETAAYGLVAVAAAVRVAAPFLPAAAYWPALVLSAAALAVAFAIYAAVYAPWLATTRADGRDG